MNITQVIRAVNDRIKQAFPDIVIQATDVREGFSRPCFYTDVADYSTEQLMTSYDRKRAVISVLYFPTDPYIYQIELLEVRERLQGAFIGTLEIDEDFIIHLLEVEDNVSDGVLNLDIELEYYVPRTEPDYPMIENVEFNT